MPTVFSTRLVPYLPGGAQITSPEVALPQSDYSVSLPISDVSVLTMALSEFEAGTIPEYLEVALQYNIGAGWVEAPNSRFFVNGDDISDDDPVKPHSLSAINLWMWKLQKAILRGATAYTATGVNSIGGLTISGIASSGSTLTKSGHGLVDGDRVIVDDRGHAKNISKGSIYYVRNATSTTLQLAGSRSGAPRVFGTSSGISLTRRRDRFSKAGHQFVINEKVHVVDDGGADGIKDRGDYYVTGPVTANTFALTAKLGGTPIHIGAVSNAKIRRSTVQKRHLSGTPGAMLKRVIDEAQSRNALTSLTYDFTATLDSAGVAWPKSFVVAYEPGTTGLFILQDFAAKGWISFSTSSRVLHVWPGGHGTDHASVDPAVTLGKKSTARNVKRSLDNLVNALTSASSDGKTVTQSGTADGPLGALEAYETQSGVTDPETSADIAANTSTLRSDPDRSYSVSESSASAEFLPFVDYLPGDIVRLELSDETIAIATSDVQIRPGEGDKTTQIDVGLGARFRDLLSKVTARQVAAASGVLVGGTGAPVSSPSAATPVAPSSVVIATTGLFAAGQATASIDVSWPDVTVDDDGNDVDVDRYQIYVREQDANESVLAVDTTERATTLSDLKAGLYHYVSIRARSTSGVWGELTDEIETTAGQPAVILDAPTTPSIDTTNGLVVLGWDGKLTSADGPHDPDASLSHVVAGFSDHDGGYVESSQPLLTAGSINQDFPVGAVIWAQLWGIDNNGNVGPSSASVSVTVKGVTIPDLESDVQDAIDSAQDAADAADAAATSAQSAADAASAAAAAAAGIANGKATVLFQSATPAAGFRTALTLWIDTTSGANTPKRWDGSNWVAVTDKAATDAATAAANAQSAADAAALAAASALSTANGKNKTIFSTLAATGTSFQDGDMWWRYTGSTIIAMWLFSSGAWVPQALTNAVIANLDAGKITSGFISSARIDANSITVRQLLVGDFTSLILDGSFDDPLDVWGQAGGANWPYIDPATMPEWTIATDQSYTGAHSLKQILPAWPSGSRPAGHYVWLGDRFQTKEGESYFAEFRVRHNSTVPRETEWLNAAYYDINGTLISTAGGDVGITGPLAANTWNQVTGKIGPAPAGAASARIQVHISPDSQVVGDPSYSVWTDSVVVRRANSGTIILDGTLSGSAVADGTLNGGTKLLPASVTADRLAAGVGTPVGTSIEGYWRTAPAGYLLEDGSTVSRVTYAALFAALVQFLGSANIAAGGTLFTMIGPTGPYIEGDIIRIPTSVATNNAGTIAAYTPLYLSYVSATTFNLKLTRTGPAIIATIGVNVPMYRAPVVFDSTTFALPDSRDTFGRAATTAYTAGTKDAAPTHAHVLSDAGQAQITLANDASETVRARVIASPSWTPVYKADSSGRTASTTALTSAVPLQGSTDAAAAIPPYMVRTRAIKY